MMVEKYFSRKPIKRSVMIFLHISFILFSSGCFPYRQLSSFTGQVVDADTKKPIAGAAVLAVYYGSTSSVGGSNSYPIDAQETLTDENGEFEIPETRRWLVFRSGGWPSGELIIFKPGYGVFPGNRRSHTVEEKKYSSPNGKYIVYEIAKLESIEEKAKNVTNIQVKYDLPFSKQEIIIKKINEEFESLGMIVRYIEKNGKPIKTEVR
jgi:hypothetical protein